MATHSSTLTRKIPWTKEHCGLQYTGSQRVRHDLATSLSFFHFPYPSPVVFSAPDPLADHCRPKPPPGDSWTLTGKSGSVSFGVTAKTETELCLSISCGGMGQQCSATGTGALGAADLGMA